MPFRKALGLFLFYTGLLTILFSFLAGSLPGMKNEQIQLILASFSQPSPDPFLSFINQQFLNMIRYSRQLIAAGAVLTVLGGVVLYLFRQARLAEERRQNTPRRAARLPEVQRKNANIPEEAEAPALPANWRRSTSDQSEVDETAYAGPTAVNTEKGNPYVAYGQYNYYQQPPKSEPVHVPVASTVSPFARPVPVSKETRIPVAPAQETIVPKAVVLSEAIPVVITAEVQADNIVETQEVHSFQAPQDATAENRAGNMNENLSGKKGEKIGEKASEKSPAKFPVIISMKKPSSITPPSVSQTSPQISPPKSFQIFSPASDRMTPLTLAGTMNRAGEAKPLSEKPSKPRTFRKPPLADRSKSGVHHSDSGEENDLPVQAPTTRPETGAPSVRIRSTITKK